MSYRPARLPPGADLRRALEDLARAEGRSSAFVIAGIGSLTGAKLRLAMADSETSLPGAFEILSLSGTLTRDGAHLHMAVADEHGHVFGGHVCYGNTVRTTAEILLVDLSKWSLTREHDAGTGYRELVVRRLGQGDKGAA